MICDSSICTGCGACEAICPKEAVITKETQPYGTVYPVIDNSKCVHCEKCKKVCPNINNISLKPITKAFAAYSKDNRIWENAASGGIGSELYRFAIENDYFCMGTFFDREKGVIYREMKSIKDIEWACSSKYVWSNMSGVYSNYEKALKQGKYSIFIGLPCQNAALLNYLREKRIDLRNLYTVNLICHGVPNWLYLNKHLTFLEKNYKKNIKGLAFRDKKCDFRMKLLSYDNKIISIHNMSHAETYGKAFLSGLIFRDNCYKCKYAQNLRCGDLTIGDYDGLGFDVPYSNPIKQVSCILVLNNKGQEMVNFISEHLVIETRPISEPIKYNAQLNHPTELNRNRKIFLTEFTKSRNFEKAVKKSIWYDLYIQWAFTDCILFIKRSIKKLLPFAYKLYHTIKKINKGKSYKK